MDNHSVEKHLKVTAEQYDAAIRTFVPHYDEMLQTGVEMGKYGINIQEAHKHFSEWATEDYYLPLIDELQCLRQAGFLHPECFWRGGPMAIFGGVASN